MLKRLQRPRAIVGAALRSATLARATGLEPATSGVTGRRSNQLSYARATGASTYGAPVAGSSPLVGGDGFEPPTLSV
jgi:hypothetical protein